MATKRNYRKEYDQFHGKPEQIANRTKRVQARRKMVKEGLASKGDGMDVDHKRKLSQGGSNARSNLRMRPKIANRKDQS